MASILNKLDREGLEPRLAGYLALCAKMAEEYFRKNEFNYAPPPKFEAEAGPRFVKIVRVELDKEGVAKRRAVHSFIERSSGDILKAASWRAPAKHPRGNVFEEDFGAASAGVGIYGVRYL